MIFTRIFSWSECGPGEHGAAGDSDRGQDVRSGALLRGVAGGGAHQHGARACAVVRSGARGGDQGRRPRLGPGEDLDFVTQLVNIHGPDRALSVYTSQTETNCQ